MSTTRTLRDVRAFDSEWRSTELPSLSTIDRLALRLGLRLILWGQRHTAPSDHAEQARLALAAEQASATRLDAYARRAGTGHTW